MPFRSQCFALDHAFRAFYWCRPRSSDASENTARGLRFGAVAAVFRLKTEKRGENADSEPKLANIRNGKLIRNDSCSYQ